MAELTHTAFHVADINACLAFYQTYAGLKVVHERSSATMRVVWLTSDSASDFVLVLLSGGQYLAQRLTDFSHLGFALDSRNAVDLLAQRAEQEGCLEWPVVDEPWPTGYYCGLRDPNGHIVEFSFGQPDARGVDETPE